MAGAVNLKTETIDCLNFSNRGDDSRALGHRGMGTRELLTK